MELLFSRLETSPALDEKELEEIFQEIISLKNIKLGALAQAVRVALTGKAASPGIYEVIKILGREETLKRLSAALQKF